MHYPKSLCSLIHYTSVCGSQRCSYNFSTWGKPSTSKQWSKSTSVTPLPKKSGASPTFTQEELRWKAAEVAQPAEHIHRIFAFLFPRRLWHFRIQLNFTYKWESTMHTAGTGQAHVTGPLEWQSLLSLAWSSEHYSTNQEWKQQTHYQKLTS